MKLFNKKIPKKETTQEQEQHKNRSNTRTRKEQEKEQRMDTKFYRIFKYDPPITATLRQEAESKEEEADLEEYYKEYDEHFEENVKYLLSTVENVTEEECKDALENANSLNDAKLLLEYEKEKRDAEANPRYILEEAWFPEERRKKYPPYETKKYEVPEKVLIGFMKNYQKTD